MQQVERSFPSQKIKAEIAQLNKIHASPTQFIGWTPQQITKFVIDNLNGEMTIDVSKASAEEKATILNACDTEIDGKKANIIIFGNNGDSSKDETGFTPEDHILRKINQEILKEGDGPDTVNVGREAYRRFLLNILGNQQNRHLVRDEWNKYIVGHGVSGKVTSPDDTHHFKNVGLKRRSEGPDPLRDEVIAFIEKVREEFQATLEEIFQDEQIQQHNSPEMNASAARALALLMAMYSNFSRGAGFLRYRRGEKSLDEYPPRRMAADIIDKLIEELGKK